MKYLMWAVAIVGIVAMFVRDSYAPAFFAMGIITVVTCVRLIINK